MTSAGHTSHPQVERISLSIPVDDTMPSPHQDEESVHDEVQHDSDSGSDETPAFSATIRRKGLSWIKATCDDQLGWISKKMDMRSWKPVIRSAIAAWVRLFDSHPHLARSFGEISLLLILVPATERKLGQSSFLVLIGALLSPPNEPFTAIVRRELSLIAAVCLSWAWSVIASALADLTRTPPKQPIDQAAIYSAKYTGQVAPNAILIVFLASGGAFFQYLRARLGPGTYVPATVFGCISIDIMITAGVLYPYPYYKLGRIVVIPLAVHSAISVACAALIFPESINAQFTKRLIAVFAPLAKALKTQPDLLRLSPHDKKFDPVEFQTLVSKAEEALIPLRASSELLTRDVSLGKLSGADLKILRDFARRLTVRCDGLAWFYRIIDPLREGFPKMQPSAPMTPHLPPSQAPTPLDSSRGSSILLPQSSPSPPCVESGRDNLLTKAKPKPSVEAERRDKDAAAVDLENDSDDGGKSRSSMPPPLPKSRSLIPGHVHGTDQAHWYGHSFHLHQKLSRLRHHGLRMRTLPLLHEVLHHSAEQDVGLFESQRYMNIEARLHIPRGNEYIETAVGLLGEASSELLMACAEAMDTVLFWLKCNNTERFKVFRSFFAASQDTKQEGSARTEKYPENSESKGRRKGREGASGVEENSRAKRECCVSETSDALKEVLEKFKANDRLKILRQYVGKDGELLKDCPPHRYLFQMFVYQFHLLEIAESLIDLLAQLQELDESRTQWRIWGPTVPWKKLLPFAPPDESELHHGESDDEDPDAVKGLQRTRSEAESTSTVHLPLNGTSRRDPDAYPPSNTVELLGSWIFQAVSALGRGNVLFATKVAVLTALICLPSFVSSSAAWAYSNKWVWAIVMAQLTSARFKGETALNFICRLIATFCGGVVGMTIWYISTGSGQGNPYGLAAVCAVFFPPILFFRTYYPGPPVTTLLTSSTIALVIGYSYKDTHNPGPANTGYGFDVAWRRFLMVVIGVTAAFLFSFLPPAVAVRRYQRTGKSTTLMELGTIFCSIISIASSQDKARQPALVKDLIIIRSKIRRFKAQAKHAAYEFSLRGKWPASRYTKMSNLQLETAYLLSHLYTVVMRMNGVWAHAFLARTRLLDQEFLGRVLSAITMLSSSLRNGTPLPQITAAPLIDLYVKHKIGLNVVSQEADYGLPHIVTPGVLANEQYLCFSVGVASVNGIVTRLDRLTMAVKELVGENFHIEGVEIPLPLAHSAIERQGER